MSIYHPFPDVDNYDRFYPLPLAKGADTIARYLNTGKYQNIEELKEWEVLPVGMQSLDTKRGDFFGLIGHSLVCNARAWSMLEPWIGQSVKIFPVEYQENTYFLLKVIDIIDCLDYNNADVFRFQETGRVLSVNKYSFNEQLIEDKHFFAIPEAKFDILVSQTFKEYIEQNGLEGLLFKQLT